jgi:hypothetical protein
MTERGCRRRLRRGDYIPDLARDLRPVRRPNIAVLIWRWRWELLLCAGLPATVVVIGTRLGWVWPLAMLGVAGGTFTAPPAWYWLTTHARCVVTTHRIRTGCAQAWVQTRYGKLPIILLTTPRPYGERAYIWCPAGISLEDFEEARDLLRAACWASDIKVMSSVRYSHIVVLDVIRYRGA